MINLSLGGTERDPLVEQAVAQAIARGSLVVAASGNDGQAGSPLGYPAVLPHVLTVAATNRSGQVASFSSRSAYVDLAAPGADITVATTRGERLAGELRHELFRANRLGRGGLGLDAATRARLGPGFRGAARRAPATWAHPAATVTAASGCWTSPAALAQPAPIRDPLEPNDDVDLVDPEATDAVGLRPLTTRRRPTARLAARLDALEDPRDAYRVWVHAIERSSSPRSPPRSKTSTSRSGVRGRRQW